MLSYEHDDDGNVTYKLRSGHSKKLHKRNPSKTSEYLTDASTNGNLEWNGTSRRKDFCTKLVYQNIITHQSLSH